MFFMDMEKLKKYADDKLQEYWKSESDYFDKSEDDSSITDDYPAKSVKKETKKVEFKSLEKTDPMPSPPKLSIKKGTEMDRILGCIYGGIIGNILASELNAKKEIDIKTEYGELNSVESTKKLMERGKVSDETLMVMAILKDITIFGGISPHSIGERFFKNYKTLPTGMDTLTKSVLKIWEVTREVASFTMEQIAESIWEKSKKQRDGNGCLPRATPIGIFSRNSIDTLISYTTKICQLTHADPRSIQSSVAIALAVALLMNNNYTFRSVVERVNEETANVLRSTREIKYETLRIDDDTMGFAYTTLRISFFILHMARDFEEGMLNILRKGGDTVINATIVGQLLGARFGLTGIPKEWILLLKDKKQFVFDVSVFAKKHCEDKTDDCTDKRLSTVESAK